MTHAHAAARLKRGTYVIRRGPDEIGMLTFAVDIPHEATVVRALCEALDGEPVTHCRGVSWHQGRRLACLLAAGHDGRHEHRDVTWQGAS